MTDSTLVGIQHRRSTSCIPRKVSQAMAFRVSRSRVYGDGQTASVRLAPARHVFRCDSACQTRADGAKTSRQRLQIAGQGPLPQFSN